MSITDKRLTEIQARIEAATDGPWDRWAGWDDRDNSVASGGREDAPTVADVIPEKDDADFIAHAREDVPALLAEVHRLKRRVGVLQSENHNLSEALTTSRHREAAARLLPAKMDW